MNLKVPRTCVEIGENNSSPLPQRLDEFREVHAYVLLGEPGAGKTTTFEREAKETNGCYVTARDFVTFHRKPEWHQTTLFIDGLDEIRAGTPDRLTPLDEIRRKLDQLGGPKFRLSCRVVDWLGTSDRSSLEALLEGGRSIRVLGLEPLSPEDVEAILKEKSGVVNAEAFIESAQQNDLDHLLYNPQSLEMLAMAVAESGGRWPEDRKQAFHLACRKLLEEGNQNAPPRPSSEPDLLTTAGKIFAVQLLSGKAGYSLDSDEDRRDYLPLNRICGGNQDEVRSVLDSRLFRALHENCVEPYHRHIAEFLAAKYLAKRISEGLTIERVLALTTGCDGGVVSEFRGLVAWLAAHSLMGRKELIERDPYGVVEYGCAREFTTDEKRQILNGLEREAQINPWFAPTLSHDHRLGDLASTDMEREFLRCFSVSEPDDAQQSFACLCLRALISGADAPDMSDVALEILEEPKWGLSARRLALDLFIQQTTGSELRADVLTNLLEAVENGRIFDPYDDLCGRLLETVYPEILSPPQVLPYLRLPKRTNYFGPYCHFWKRLIVEQSTDRQLGELLDLLAEPSARPSEGFSWASGPINPLHNLPTVWLEHYLENSPKDPDPRHLLRWLETVRDTQMGTSSEKIRNWLSNHPETLLEVYGLGIDQCVNSNQFNLCIYHANERLSGALFPKSFGLWCLERATATRHAEIAQHLVRSAANCLRHQHCHDGLSREIAKDRLSAKPDFLEAFTKHMEPEDEASDDSPTGRYKARRRAEILERQKQWHADIKPMQEDLRENRGRPSVLHELATAYYGGYTDVEGNTPEERLENLLGKDKELVQSILQAFRMSIDREDLPSAKEVIRLGAKNQTHLLSYPYMAGLNEISEVSRDRSLSINEEQMRLALAIYYTVPLWPLSLHAADAPPQWFPSLLQSRPEVVSDILVKAIRRKFHSNADSTLGLYALAHSPDYKEVARTASLPLLKAFPVRCSRQRLQDLNYLLIAAVLYCEQETLLNIIGKKLSSRTMHVGQRVRWLAAGFFAKPEEYQDKLESYVAGNEPRIRALAEIMTSRFLDTFPDSPNVSALSLLIRLLGSSYGPYYYDADDSSMMACPVTLGMDAAHSIRFFCKKLAKIPTSEATESLGLLREEEELRAWRHPLTDLLHEQKVLCREAGFRHGNIEDVLQVIENARPANPADLAAVAMMKLEEVARDIRDGNTSDWREFWTSEKNDSAPQHEDFCRDRLLSKLRPLLTPLDIDAQPEGRYANEKRSDIRLSHNGFNVPIEIKKSGSPDLWSAVREQLIPKYTRDPKARGYGIYLTLWFGREFCKATESGSRPSNAGELKQYLLEMLSEEEKQKIKVCAIDVSRQS